MITNIPKTEKDFLGLMEEIDDQLRKRNIPIYDRPIHAPLEISKRLKITLPLMPLDGDAISGEYSGNSLSSHIHNWYKKRYGERLKAQMGVGSGVILIKNEPWKIISPLIFGSVYFVCAVDIEKYKNSPSINTDGKPHIINIFNLIEDFPENLAKTITREEAREIKQTFLSGLNALSYLDSIKSMPLIKEVKADLEVAVNSLLSQPPQYGLSKWHSLQFSEKLLKAYLKSKKKSFPYSHDISKLTELAISNGLPQLQKPLIDQVQCPAGVRYGNPEVTLEETVKSHYSSLGICFFVSKEIYYNK